MICYWKYFFIIVLNIFMVTTDQSFEVFPQQLISKELKEETNVDFSMTNDQVDYYIEYFKPGREVETEIESGLNPEDSDICNQPLEEGSCFFSFLLTRWYYDSSNDKCNTFQYSGCGGNDNNFYGLHDCVKRCVKKITEDETTVVDLLSTNSQVDNTYTEPFTEETEIWKEDRASVCSQPKDFGYCELSRIKFYYLRWYYKNTTNDCRIFWYTGCGGNGNRFHDSKTCESLCVRSTSKDITTMYDWKPTSDQLHTFGYEDPKIEETERNINNVEGDEVEIIVENRDNKFHSSRSRIIYIILIIALFVAVTGLRWLIVKCRHAEREVQLLRDTREAERTQQQPPCSDEDSSPVRISMCIISLNNSENQSRNEPTPSCDTLRSDKNSSQSQPFLPSYQQSYFPPAPPPYEP